jgi:hypothetical protein
MYNDCSEWFRGCLTSASWHKHENVVAMPDADAMIHHGEQSGAWPTAIRFDKLATLGGLSAPGRAVVATYAQHPEACLAVVGDRYRATTPDEWRSLVRAATAAGARPMGAFALRDGSRILATFAVGQRNGIETYLNVMDTLDGTSKLACGTTAIRTVCRNTVAAWVSADGDGMACLRHTASLETKINVLRESIGTAIATGEKVRAAYHAAESMRLTTTDAQKVFDKLFPSASEDADKAAKSRAENARNDARYAMINPVNSAGPTLATIWNAATYLVDRLPNGAPRPTRGGTEALDSMLFGSRGERVEEIQTIIDVIMRDGSIQHMTAPAALDIGVDPAIVGRKLLEDILSDMN